MTGRTRCEGTMARGCSTTRRLTQFDVPQAFLAAGADFLAQECGDGERGRRGRAIDRRSENELARHRPGYGRGFKPPVGDLAVDRRGRQQREAEALLDEAGQHAEGIRLELDVELDPALGRRVLD